MQSSVKQFLDNRKLNYKESSHGWIAVEVCPLCGDGNFHFYIHGDRGSYSCKKCFQGGNLFTLKMKLGEMAQVSSVSEALKTEIKPETLDDDYAKELYASLMQEPSSEDNTLLYLKSERGLNMEVIQKFRLGLSQSKGMRWLAIPYLQSGNLVNVKYRSLPPSKKAFRLEPDCETPLFNVDCLKDCKDVIVTEGELDCVSCVQHGFPNTVSLPLGAGSFLPEHFDALVDKDKIYLCLDNDAAGKKGAAELANRLGKERCFEVNLPCKDTNDFFRTFGAVEFQALLDEAKPFGKSSVVNMLEAFQRLEESLVFTEGDVRFPWSEVNKRVGTIQPGELLSLTALPKTGKTTFLLNTFLDLSLNYGMPTLLYCIEMPIPRLMQMVVGHYRQADRNQLERYDIVMSKAGLWKCPFYLCTDVSNLTLEYISDTIKYAVKRFGLKAVAFDNLHFLCRGENMTQQVGAASRLFKTLAVELGIVFFEVTQPKKLTSTMASPGIMDLRDSSLLPADVDHMMFLWRKPNRPPERVVTEEDFDNQEEYLDRRTLVRVVSRYRGGGSACLWFDCERATFKSLSDAE